MTAVPDTGSKWEGRHRAREAALLMLYQVEIGRLSMPDATRLVGQVGAPEEAAELAPADRAFAIALATGTWGALDSLDAHVAESARNWRVERMATLDRLVLRMAVRELLAHPETPPRVVIDEAIELARAYSGDEAARFVNGVLDGVLKKLRSEEKVVE